MTQSCHSQPQVVLSLLARGQHQHFCFVFVRLTSEVTREVLKIWRQILNTSISPGSRCSVNKHAYCQIQLSNTIVKYNCQIHIVEHRQIFNRRCTEEDNDIKEREKNSFKKHAHWEIYTFKTCQCITGLRGFSTISFQCFNSAPLRL